MSTSQKLRERPRKESPDIRVEFDSSNEDDIRSMMNKPNAITFKTHLHSSPVFDTTFLQLCVLLKTIEIAGQKIREIDLYGLSRLQELETFSLESTSLKDIDLSPMSHCSSLKRPFVWASIEIEPCPC